MPVPAGMNERSVELSAGRPSSALPSLYAPTIRLLKSATLRTSSVMGTWLTRAAAGAVRVSLINLSPVLNFILIVIYVTRCTGQGNVTTRKNRCGSVTDCVLQIVEPTPETGAARSVHEFVVRADLY